MSDMEKAKMLGIILGIIAAIFMIIEVGIWAGAWSIPELGNLNSRADELFANPAFVGLIMTLTVGVASGYMENFVVSKEGFSLTQFSETFFYYEPLFIFFAQVLPIEETAILLFVIDILRRVFRIFRSGEVKLTAKA